MRGVWIGISVGELLTLLALLLFVWRKAGRITFSREAFCYLDPAFGAAAEDVLECRVCDMKTAMEASERMYAFCKGAHGGKGAMLISLCTEEVSVKKAWLKSLDQVRGAAVPLLFGVGLVYVFRNSANPAVEVSYLMSGKAAGLGSMLTMMADGLGYLFRDFYLWVSPLVGVVGAFVSGSNTVSNTLFAGLQFETAVLLGLPQVLVIALQNAGGAIGNMICVNNVISACATTSMTGNEGRIIRLNFLPCLLYWLLLSGSAALMAG